MEGSSFPGLVPPSDTVNSESVVGIQLGDSRMLSGYQIDTFTDIRCADWFVACSHISPGFTVKMSSLTIFHLNQGVKIIHF